MIPFVFKISVENNSIHFFPVKNDYPFFKEKSPNAFIAKIEDGIQRTFNRLMTLQRSLKRKPLDLRAVEKLLIEINRYTFGSDGLWIKTLESENANVLHTFTLVSKSQLFQIQRFKRKQDDQVESANKKRRLGSISDSEGNIYFRPWQ